ncbi:HAD family hydrolase [Streptomyces griseus]|uniref:HAD family hydrolase n=1 Tax=Streptomyces griseus TaxID=1911 RepID=UPI0037CD4C72
MRCPPTSTHLATSLLPHGAGAASDVVPHTCPPCGPAAVQPRPTSVILDLFGTLVAAPESSERSAAAAQLAWAMRAPMAVAEAVLSGSWQPRHDGQLRSSTAVATHLIERCGASAACTNEVEAVLARLAHHRLLSDRTLLQALKELRQEGIRLAVLSDASPDIAEAWDRSELASHFDAVVFSCRAGAVKPDRRLFQGVLGKLGADAGQVLYCGDGGGDELAGAERAGMRALRVARRGGPAGLAFGEAHWSGRTIPAVEFLPSLLGGWGAR